jgi:CheY-like chemotaxis protein
MNQQEAQKSSHKLVLLIEDNEVTTAILRQMLAEDSTYRVEHARDAETAWQMLSHVKPDIILLDYDLPGMNGIELYDRLHLSESLRAIPVLFMGVTLPIKALEQRQVPFLYKPFESETLRSRIEKLLYV